VIRTLSTFAFLAVALSPAASAAAHQVSCPTTLPLSMTLSYGDDANTNCQLTEVGQIALFAFQGNTGDVITIAIESSWSNGPCFGLYDPTNTEVADACGNSGEGTVPFYSAASGITLAMTGQYTIQVHDANYSNTGTFGLMLDGWYPVAVASPLTLGLPSNGTTVNDETIDDWSFSGTVGEEVSVQVNSSYSNGPCFSLGGPTGVAVGNACGNSGVSSVPIYQVRGEYTLTAIGTYVVRVYSSGYYGESYEEKGTYSLLVQCLAGCPLTPTISSLSPPAATGRVGVHPDSQRVELSLRRDRAVE